MFRRQVDLRGVGLFVLLDLLTFATVYWLLLPALDQVLATLDPTTVVATGHVLTAVRLTFIGAIVTRSVRSRRGLVARTDVVPTVVVAAVVAWALQSVLGVAALLVIGLPAFSWSILLALVEWVAFGLLGAMFVQPGDAATMPLRFRADASDRGSVSLFLIPATVALLFVTLLAIAVLGSATNDRREATTAADAAALAAADQWKSSLKDYFDLHAGASDHDAFWALAGTRMQDVTSQPAMQANASSFAARNDAELIDFTVDYATAQVSVRVRNNDTVPQSRKRVESTATAGLELRSGLCRSGVRLGYLIGGTCRTSPEVLPTPTPVPTPSPDETPVPVTPEPVPPFSSPVGLGGFRLDTVLTG
ncbi:MAG: pilus assembly protein TadG-related protein [Cellulomonas sp.]